MAVHSALGPGLSERCYENALVIELAKSGHAVDQQRVYPVHYDGHSVGRLVPDLVVDERIIVDTKVVDGFDDARIAQMLTDLSVSDLPLTLLVNFAKPRLKWRRVVRSDRRAASFAPTSPGRPVIGTAAAAALSFAAMPEPEVILATDCGSTTTKAILIEKTPDGYRQTARGEAPTTVEEPAADVTVGVVNAAREVGELAGRRLVTDDGQIMRPRSADGRDGCDLYISTSSAGGGLQMLVTGVVREMSAESAKRAALGAGAIVLDVLAANDRRAAHEQIQRIRDIRPDMILMSGGSDGGTVKHVVEMAELIAPAKPQPRFGGAYRMPVIYAGNAEAADEVAACFDDSVALSVVGNVRPVLERESLGPARDEIHELFLDHVMQHAPGYPRLIDWTDAPIMPTPGAVGLILQQIAQRDGVNAVGVDIGGATTDVFSVFTTEATGGEPAFNRTVSANLGMSYSISNVVAEAGLANVMRWVPPELRIDERQLRNRVKNKMIRPTTIPQTAESLAFEQAVAREALRLAYRQHREFAVTLKGGQRQRTVGDLFRQTAGGESIVDNMALDLLVASGGVLSHAPLMSQTAQMLVDAFEPEGITDLAKDSIFMMPHLGVLSQVHPEAALEVFEADCLIRLGTSVAPVWRGRGEPASRQPCLEWTIGEQSGTLRVGEQMTIETDGPVKATLRPAKRFDIGEGPGVAIERELRGGPVGILLDGRGRPLPVPA